MLTFPQRPPQNAAQFQPLAKLPGTENALNLTKAKETFYTLVT